MEKTYPTITKDGIKELSCNCELCGKHMIPNRLCDCTKKENIVKKQIELEERIRKIEFFLNI